MSRESGKEVRSSSYPPTATTEQHEPTASYAVSFSVSPIGRRSFVSMADPLSELLCLPLDELRATPDLYFDLIHCDHRGPFEEALDQASSKVAPFDLTFMQYTREGDLFQMHLHADPAKQEDGTIVWNGEQSMMSIREEDAIRPRLRSGSPYPRRSRLDRVDVPVVLKELERLFVEGSVYLDEDICLEELARRLQVTPHALSELLNRRLGMTYYEYVSRWRVAEACRLLCQGEQRTILQIGYDSGFHSKVAFHEAFRRFTSLSPGEYRKVRCSEAGWEERRKLLIPLSRRAAG